MSATRWRRILARSRPSRPSRPGPATLATAVWAVVLVLAAATVAGFASPGHWTLVWADAPRPHYAGALVVAGAAAAALRRWGAVGVAALAAAANLAVVVPVWVAPPAEPRAGEGELDVVFFNTKIRSDADAVAAWLTAEQPDVAVLAATTSSWVRTMAQRSGMEVAVSRPPGMDLELLVLTADEPADAGILDWAAGDGRDRGVEATVELGGQPVRVLGLHPVSPLGRERHGRRDVMLGHVADWVRAADTPAVVAGDLNAVPWSSALRRLRDEAGLVDSLDGHGLQPSWPAPLAWTGLPLDHVLHTPDLVTVERELGPSFGSDHRLVRARLSPAD